MFAAVIGIASSSTKANSSREAVFSPSPLPSLRAELHGGDWARVELPAVPLPPFSPVELSHRRQQLAKWGMALDHPSDALYCKHQGQTTVSSSSSGHQNNTHVFLHDRMQTYALAWVDSSAKLNTALTNSAEKTPLVTTSSSSESHSTSSQVKPPASRLSFTPLPASRIFSLDLFVSYSAAAPL
nr:hypothetical protein Iba_chr07bCG6860 [Ipomoea batatas]